MERFNEAMQEAPGAPSPGKTGPSDAELRFFYRTAPVLMGAVELSPDGDILHLHDNPAARDFFGLEAGPSLPRTARSLGVPEETIRMWRGRYAEAALTGAPVTFDYAHARPDGTVWLSVTVERLGEGLEGERFGYVARDVTARRQAELALAESEARFRATFEQAAVGIAHVALDGRWIHVNRRLSEILGYSDEELRGLTFQAVTHPDDLNADLAFVDRLIEGELSAYRMEKRYVRKGGAIVWGQLTVALVRDSSGAPDHFISVVEDITQQREAEMALRAAEERLSLATKASGLGVWEWDLVAGDIYYSPRAKEICGFGPDEEVTYERLAAMVHPDDVAETQARSRRARDPAIRASSALEYRVVRPDGEVRWVRALGDTVFEVGPDGDTATRYLGTLEDITERKQNEERLALLTREVDHRANNLLAVVQGLVTLTAAGRDEDLREVMTGRIAALGHAHKLLAEARWTGADLHRLAGEELKPYGLDRPGRIRLEGPACSLSPAQAQAMGMALHELATNAAKYGGLSVPEGSVSVVWSREGDELDLRWTEAGGPPVEKPRREGLGSRILERALGGPIAGSVTREWAPEGLRCRLRIRLAGAG